MDHLVGSGRGSLGASRMRTVFRLDPPAGGQRIRGLFPLPRREWTHLRDRRLKTRVQAAPSAGGTEISASTTAASCLAAHSDGVPHHRRTGDPSPETSPGRSSLRHSVKSTRAIISERKRAGGPATADGLLVAKRSIATSAVHRYRLAASCSPRCGAAQCFGCRLHLTAKLTLGE